MKRRTYVIITMKKVVSFFLLFTSLDVCGQQLISVDCIPGSSNEVGLSEYGSRRMEDNYRVLSDTAVVLLFRDFPEKGRERASLGSLEKTGRSGAPVVYMELRGLYSLDWDFGPLMTTINFDRRFNKGERGWGYRAGAGAAFAVEGSKGKAYYVIPLGVNYLAGKKGRYFDVGAGAYVTSLGKYYDGNGEVIPYLGMGYRYQRFQNRGWVLKASGSFLFYPPLTYGMFYPSFELGAGYRF